MPKARFLPADAAGASQHPVSQIEINAEAPQLIAEDRNVICTCKRTSHFPLQAAYLIPAVTMMSRMCSGIKAKHTYVQQEHGHAQEHRRADEGDLHHDHLLHDPKELLEKTPMTQGHPCG
jgi:hypothetical protein